MSKSRFITHLYQLRPYLLSGLLFSLSYPSYPWVRFELLAWVCLVPMLLALRSVTSFRVMFALAWVTMFVGCLQTMMWCMWANPWLIGGFVVVATFILAAPFAVFGVIQKRLNRRVALWTLPVVWTASDWIHHSLDGTFGGLGFGVTQHKLTWLIQFIDVTGVWGLTFWLVLMNVAITVAIEEFQARRQSAGEPVARQYLIRRLALTGGGLLLVPLLYSAWVFSQPERFSNHGQLSVMLVQPNVNPWVRLTPELAAQVIGQTVIATNSALKVSRPDLIVWPEVAVPSVLLQNQSDREFLSRQVRRWNVPLVTGTLDMPSQSPSSSASKSNLRLVWNSSVMVSPERNASGQVIGTTLSAPYHKQKLMPFFERVPLVQWFPSLERFTSHPATANRLIPGRTTSTFSFQTTTQQTVTVGAPVCYEHFYPQLMADFVRNGANLLVLLSNDGWFAKTHGEYQIAAFTELRAIETRRAIARCANTGITCLIDPYGRTYQALPWWQEDVLIGTVPLSTRLSVYVRYPDVFPKMCVWLTLAVVLGAFRGRAEENGLKKPG
ncbi:MAG TPA: apolipoprotein N-acyltransferase [Acidobacteriota bacterium]|nr:apolipoprotein N-acyltransferase [Acidobacteriota bacterium]